jgi:hypothetical protein
MVSETQGLGQLIINSSKLNYFHSVHENLVWTVQYNILFTRIVACQVKLTLFLVHCSIDSKLYPQFQADVHDAWHLMRNLFDANALSLTYGSSVQSLDQFTQAYFGFAVGLDHHADDGGKDHLISGLNTTGSLIPITFSVNITQDAAGWWTKLRTMCGGGFRPTIFCNMTSTLMVFRDRTISVLN